MPQEDPVPDNVIAFPPGGKGAAPEPTLPGFAETDSQEREVTVLLAELRDWTTVSSTLGVEKARRVLSKVIESVLACLGEFGGEHLVLDGDPAQPSISCDFEGHDAPERALRASVRIRKTVAEMQAPSAPDEHFQVGMGIDAGEITRVSDETLTYQAVGAMRIVAARLRDFAGPGQIFLTRRVYEDVGPGFAVVQPLGDVRISVHGETKEVFSLTNLSG
jgi:adenylate cyclase